MLLSDAHLDLAFNALNGRDPLFPAAQQPTNEDGIATVGIPDLRAGGVRFVCGTIFCEPAAYNSAGKGYTTADEARAVALAQYDFYKTRPEAFSFVRTARDLPDPNEPATSNAPIKLLLLLEGADPLRTPTDVPEWFERGLRMVGMAWKRTRYAGGTGHPGPLTPLGVELVKELDRHGIIHDASHLAEESFWQLLELTDRPVVASHSNCRAIVPTDRQLSDDMVRAVVSRGGVIGINFYDKFLLEPAEYGKRPSTFADVVRHIQHICSIAGNSNHVAIGTDMDGGFGRGQIPQEITTSADLPKLHDVFLNNGFTPDQSLDILGRNWLRFFRDALPK